MESTTLHNSVNKSKLPFNQLTSDYNERFTFTGKERDEETGYGYFDARYMDHELMTMWLSVDPMADKYPSISPYAYCAWNPVKLVDPDGREISPIFSTEGELLGTDDEGYGGRAIVMDKNKFRQGMSHEEAKKEGQFLDKYGKGIRISDKGWETVVSNGGERQKPTISNESDHTIYYKPEGVKDDVNMNPGYSASGAYPIAPHTDLYASADGVAARHIRKGEVFKMPDGLRIRVSNSRISRLLNFKSLDAFCASFVPYKGGWEGGSWQKYLHANCICIPTVSVSVSSSKQKDYSWDKLFQRSN